MYRYTIRRSQRLTATTHLLTMEAEGEQDQFEFSAGQYVAMHFESDGRPTPARCFSIVSSPGEQPYLQIAFKIGGQYTQTMSQLEVGDTVFVQGPFGEFVLADQTSRNLIFLAGGIGITPFMSLVRDISQRHLPYHTQLLYGSRKLSDIAFDDELKVLQNHTPNLSIDMFVSDTAATAVHSQYTQTGRIDQSALQAATGGNWQNFRYYLCGPAPFMASLTTILRSQGVPESQIYSEAFSQGAKLTGKNAAATKTMYKLSMAGLALSLALIAGQQVYAARQRDQAAQIELTPQPEISAASTPSPAVTPTPSAPVASTTPVPSSTYVAPTTTPVATPVPVRRVKPPVTTAS